MGTMLFTVIDRYISRLFLGFFIAGLVVFVTLFVAVDFMSNLVRYNAPAAAVMQFYGYYLPEVFYKMMPVACLLATVFTLSTLNRSNELVALFSSGMSLARVSTPILTLVLVISGLSFWMGDRLLPIVTQKKNYVFYVEISKQPSRYSTVKTNKIWYRSHNIIFNIKYLNPEVNQAAALTMYYFDDSWKLIQLITAKYVQMKHDTWDLKDGTVTLFTQETNVPLTQSFATKTLIMGEDAADLTSTSHTSDVLSLKDLARFIQRNKEAGVDTLRYEVDYHAKFGFAFAAFVMSFIGIPFSISRQRSGGSVGNMGICVLLAFLYWAAYSSGLTLGHHGALPPVVAAWIANICMLGITLILLLRLKR